MKIRVLIADHQAMVRTGFGMILGAQPDIEVVGEAADGVEAVEAARRLRPDVGLFDIRMPRLDGLQAVVLRAKLARLAAWSDARRAAAARYDELLASLDVVRPVTAPGNEHVWHLYVIRVRGLGRRDRVLAALNAAGIGAGIHYPAPVHLTGAFRDLGYAEGDFPHAEEASGEILSLPRRSSRCTSK